MLNSILNTVMFEKCRIQWSMSRPLLGLILLNEDVSFSIYHIVTIFSILKLLLLFLVF